jgi:TAP-like protein
VSTTHDPATPYEAGVDLAHQMGAALITFDGTQHTVVFNGDQCVDAAVMSFLVDSVVPPADLRC